MGRLIRATDLTDQRIDPLLAARPTSPLLHFRRKRTDDSRRPSHFPSVARIFNACFETVFSITSRRRARSCASHRKKAGLELPSGEEKQRRSQRLFRLTRSLLCV